MSKREWIKKNREHIDKVVREAVPNCTINDQERAEWVSSNEGLYLMAKADGVTF